MSAYRNEGDKVVLVTPVKKSTLKRRIGRLNSEIDELLKFIEDCNAKLTEKQAQRDQLKAILEGSQ